MALRLLLLLLASGVRQSGLRRLGLGQALLELVHTAGRIDELLLTRVERMGERADAEQVKRVFLTVFSLGGEVGVGAGLGQERLARGRVAEDHRAVVFRMHISFHSSKERTIWRSTPEETSPYLKEYEATVTHGS